MKRLNEARPRSQASLEAEKRGLVRAPGFGNYADPSDPQTVVARSIKGKLVTVDPKQDKTPKRRRAYPEPRQAAKAKETPPDQGPDSTIEKEPASKSQKNKNLRKVDTSNTEVFTQPLPESREEFDSRASQYLALDKPFAFSDRLRASLLDARKVPVSVVEFLERGVGIADTPATRQGAFFAGDASVGAGQSYSNMGEVMSLIATTMTDEESDAFFDELHRATAVAQKSNPKLIVTPSWISAAEQNRFANLEQLRVRYGNDFEVEAGAWDVAEQVEALGLENPKENKEKSTDIFFKVRSSKGTTLEEISLKKDLGNRLYNGSASMLTSYDPALKGTEYDPAVYIKEMRQRLAVGGQKFKKEILALAESGRSSALNGVMKSKKIKSLDQLSDLLEQGPASKEHAKVIKVGLAEVGKVSPEAKQYYDEHMRAGGEFVGKATQAMLKSDDLRKGVVGQLRESIPLKAISEGSERMTAGAYTVDDLVLMEIYGTNDWNEIQENLIIQKDKRGNPFLGYQTKANGEVFSVARIEIREDRKGYGQYIRFDLRFDPTFSKRIGDANSAVYPMQKAPNTKKREERAKQKAMGEAALTQNEIMEVIREEVSAYLKRKKLDMSESEYRKMAMSMFEAEGEGPFGKSGSGLAKPADKKSKKPDNDESPFDRVRKAQNQRSQGQTPQQAAAQGAAQGAAAGQAAGGGQPGADGQGGSEPNEKEKEMTKDLHKLNKADSPPKSSSALTKATVKYYKMQGDTDYPSQKTMKILDTNQARIISFAQKAFQRQEYAPALRTIENRLRELYKVDDKDVMNVASAIAHILKKDTPPKTDPLRRTRGHHRAYNPFRGY